MKSLEQEKIIGETVMFMFAKDKAHMSGYVVMMFYILVLADIGICGKTFNTENEPVGLFEILFGISSLICTTGLIILLNAYKIGGYIALIGSVSQFVSGAFSLETFNGNKWEALLGFLLVHVISVLIVLFGSRNHYLK